MNYFKFNSKKIFYRIKGEGPLLLILPGNSASSAAHEVELKYFSSNYCAVCPDYLGTGRSERIDYRGENWWKYSAVQINSLIDHLGYKKVNIIGTSGGAVVGVHLAADFPKKVKMLILDSFSRRLSPNMYYKNIFLPRSKPDKFQRDFWSYCHGKDWEEVIVKDTRIIKKLVDNGGEWIGSKTRLIRCPVLLTGSMGDDFLPDIVHDYTDLTSEIRNCKMIISEKGGHPLIWSNRDFFLKQATNFLNRSKFQR